MAIDTGHRSNNYSESKRNDHLDNNRRQDRRQEQRNKLGPGHTNSGGPGRVNTYKYAEAESVRVSDCINVYKEAGYGWRELGLVGFDSMDQVESMERCVWIDWWVCLGIMGSRGLDRVGPGRWGSNVFSRYSLILWKGRMQRVLVWMKFGNEEHLDAIVVISDSPKNVKNDSCQPSCRVLREEDVRGVESDLVDTFEEGEIRDDSVLYNDGCIKDCMEKNLEDDAVIAPEKDSYHCGLHYTPGNDLNIAAESGFLRGLIILVLL
ncbi:hypothetical protein Tco_0746011 [Tanacetum coccineum]